MKDQRKQVVALYMLSAYSQNLMDLIDTIETSMKAVFRHDIKSACKQFYKRIGSNKMLNNLLDEMFEVDSIEYNNFRNEVEKTIECVLKHSPKDHPRLGYARKIIEDKNVLFFTEKELMQFAVMFKASNSLSVSEELESFIENHENYDKIKDSIDIKKVVSRITN